MACIVQSLGDLSVCVTIESFHCFSTSHPLAVGATYGTITVQDSLLLCLEEVLVLLFKKYPFMGPQNRQMAVDSTVKLLVILHRRDDAMRVLVRKACTRFALCSCNGPVTAIQYLFDLKNTVWYLI